jgi:hypothetical protein
VFLEGGCFGGRSYFLRGAGVFSRHKGRCWEGASFGAFAVPARVTCLFAKEARESAIALPPHFVGVSLAQEIM